MAVAAIAFRLSQWLKVTLFLLFNFLDCYKSVTLLCLNFRQFRSPFFKCDSHFGITKQQWNLLLAPYISISTFLCLKDSRKNWLTQTLISILPWFIQNWFHNASNKLKLICSNIQYHIYFISNKKHKIVHLSITSIKFSNGKSLFI